MAAERAPDEPATSALACPRCRGALHVDSSAARCPRCACAWPRVDGAIDFLAPPEHNEGDRERRP